MNPPPPPPPSSSSCLRHPDEKFTGFCPSCLFDRLTTLNPSSSTTTNPSSSRRTSTAAAGIKSLFSKPPKSTKSFLPELRRSKSFSVPQNDVVLHTCEPQRKSCDVRVRNFGLKIDESKNCEIERISGESDEFEECEVEENNVDEIVEEDVEINENVDLKPMKEFLDLDLECESKKASSLGGMKESFRSAASVFSKKWHDWRRKQKDKKEKNVEKHVRDSESEVVDYGLRRRSCDVDSRLLSIDGGRISFDDPRCSFEQPRASWDGHLLGRSFPKMRHPMDSLVEDAPIVHIREAEKGIMVEEEEKVDFVNEDENVPGGSAQTRNYYADSSTRRRKSLDRSSSIRKMAASVVAEMDEMKAVSNGIVSPETRGNLNGTKVSVGEGILKESNNECSKTLELGCSRDNETVIGNEERKGSKKSSWSWKLWAFINKRSGWRKDDDERCSRANGVERSLSESCQGLRSNGNAELRDGVNRKIFRSSSSVSWRNTPNFEAAFGGVNRQEVGTNDLGRKRTDDFVLERNRSGRYSPNNVNNGLLRFYLTPLRSSRSVGPGKNRLNSSQSIARSILQLY